MVKKSKFKKALKKEWENIIFNVIFVGLVLLIVTLFYRNIILTTVLEIILGIIGLIKWKSKLTLALFIIGGFIGGTLEGIVIYTSGAWSYAIPNVFGVIPFWLFVVWANAGAFIFETANEIKNLGIKDA